MTQPVAVPATPVQNSDAQVARVEVLVQAFAQAIMRGSSGASDPALNVAPTLVPVGVNPPIDPATGEPMVAPVDLTGADVQKFFRQLATAIVVTQDTSSVVDNSGSIKVTVACPEALTIGTVVYVSADLQVQAADAANRLKMPAIGVVSEKPTPTSAIVTCAGLVTITSPALTPGSRYFVGFGGSIVSSVPSSTPNTALYLQELGIAVSSNSLLLSGAMGMAQYWSA